MNERLKYPIVITLICLVAAAALAFTFAKTRARIEASKKGELVNGLAAVLPGEKTSIDERPLPNASTPAPKDDEKLYVALGPDTRPLAYAAIGTAQGYSSKVKVLVGVTPDIEIIAVRILSQEETPGLGERTKEVPPTKTIWRAIADLFTGGEDEPKLEPPFQKQFRGKSWNDLTLTKQKDADDAITQLTGATVTSQAVVNAVKNAITKIETAVKHADGEE